MLRLADRFEVEKFALFLLPLLSRQQAKPVVVRSTPYVMFLGVTRE